MKIHKHTISIDIVCTNIGEARKFIDQAIENLCTGEDSADVNIYGDNFDIKAERKTEIKEI